jgi:hypothetical protein
MKDVAVIVRGQKPIASALFPCLDGAGLSLSFHVGHRGDGPEVAASSPAKNVSTDAVGV